MEPCFCQRGRGADSGHNRSPPDYSRAAYGHAGDYDPYNRQCRSGGDASHDNGAAYCNAAENGFPVVFFLPHPFLF
jgi:hypothetical protein